MLSFLAERSNGSKRSMVLSSAEATRRTYSLELSKAKDVQRIHMSSVNTLDLDPVESRYLLSGGGDGVVAIYDVQTRPMIKEWTCPYLCGVGRSNPYVHKRSVETVQWYPHDTGMFITSSMDEKVKVWDTNALMPAEEFDMKHAVYSHHMSSIATQHCLIAVGSMGSRIKLCDLKTGSSTHILKGHKDAVVSVQWSNKEEYLLASGSRDGRILLWDVRHASGYLRTLDQYNGELQNITSAKLLEQLLEEYTRLCTRKSIVLAWIPSHVGIQGNERVDLLAKAALHMNMAELKIPYTDLRIHTAHKGDVSGLCFADDGLFLISFGTDNRLRLWDVASGKNTLLNFGRVLNESGKSVKFTCSVGSNPGAAFVPTVNDISVYDLQNGEMVYDLKGHYHKVNCCIFHPHLQELYSGGNDSNILVWEPDLDRQPPTEEEEETERGDDKGQAQVTSATPANATADAWSSDEDD